MHWKDRCREVVIRFRGYFAYVDAFPLRHQFMSGTTPEEQAQSEATPTHLAWEAGVDHISELRDLWPTLWDANRAVAETYGLDPDDLAHILNSFPVFARKRPEFFAYLGQRLEGWRAERQT